MFIPMGSQSPSLRPWLESGVSAIPPAWVDVWICPWANGHIQAFGTDAAGRRQYRYHDAWSLRRGREKFAASKRSAEPCRRCELWSNGIWQGTAYLASGCSPPSSDFSTWAGSASEAKSMRRRTTPSASRALRKHHVRIADGGRMYFHYAAKGSIDRTVEIADDAAADVAAALHGRRSGGDHLFAYKNGHRWHDIDAHDVNDYIKEAIGEDFSAKDFRTWSATVLAATALMPVETGNTNPGRRSVVKAAVATVAHQLGNTPAVCRSSYIDPRVIDRFECGETIGDRLPNGFKIPDAEERRTKRLLSRRRSLEKAVLRMIQEGSDPKKGTRRSLESSS